MASTGGSGTAGAGEPNKASMAELDKNFQESLQTSLRLILEVRANAQDVFKTFLEGGVKPIQNGSASNGSSEAKDGTTEGADTKYLSQIKLKLDNIDSKVKDLETVVSKHQPIFSHPLGHTIYLNTDISQESVGLYSSLVNSYKWWNKTHDYATGAVTVLGQNNLQRSKQSTRDQLQQRRRRPGEPLNKAHFVHPEKLDQLIKYVSGMYQDMRFRVTRPNASKSNAIVEVTLDRLLTASIVFKGLMIEWVMVRGYDEAHRRQDAPGSRSQAPSTPGDLSCPDVWTESRYQVFRRITDNSNAAMLNFHSPTYPEVGAKSFFTYLHSFVNLFTEKCRSCGYHLHNNMPPTWREFKSLDPYHEGCRR